MTEFPWNFDMEEAPKGRTVKVDRKHPKTGAMLQSEHFVPDTVILASKCGKVTTSHFIPAEQRWNMFAAGEQPVAWMPWPTHPLSTTESSHE